MPPPSSVPLDAEHDPEGLDPALQRTLERFADRLMHSVRSHGGFKDLEPADLVQEARLRLLSFLGRGGHVRNTEAFLKMTMLNVLRDHARSPLRKGTVSEAAEPPVDADTPETAVIAAEGAADLARLIAELMDRAPLAPLERKVVRLRLGDEFSPAHVARTLGTTVGTVNKSLSTAIKKMRAAAQAERGRQAGSDE